MPHGGSRPRRARPLWLEQGNKILAVEPREEVRSGLQRRVWSVLWMALEGLWLLDREWVQGVVGVEQTGVGGREAAAFWTDWEEDAMGLADVGWQGTAGGKGH